ncbi:Fic family protein [Cryobacterium sp. 5B3]|uniref:Fic family protein n=1 Tax=Cryobacterium sp. 5B3 TaxID=3048586 RepID=UPI002AB5D3DE|nr:Fic family protein [Cryobacterium sp. 5B3]MDY7541804.1 Fic family protein [Cryobacterium sp. 5B3]MEB0276373.1 Fic family protein [Cryobacterium sp. 5B3]
MPTPEEKSPWPSIRYEERPWHSLQHESGSQRLASGPYLASVPAFIADLQIPFDSELNALTEEAASELARFDAEVGKMAAPFASILLLAESAASSKIEHITSGAREIALAELGERASENAQLIVGNVRAMQAALSLSGSIDGTAILEMHRALLERSNPGIVGHWRDQQVWIGVSILGPHTAQFVPPHQDRVPELMDDLLTFANRVDLPVLAQTAIAHAQFETIHPFPDGNGRVGRSLIQAILRGGELTRNVAVPVSAGLLRNTGRYFDALGAYRSGNVTPIIRSIAEASFAAVHNGRILVADLEGVQSEWRGRIRARQDSAAHRLVGVLLRQPVIGAAAAAAQLGVSTVNAQVAIDRLVDAGVLTQITDGRRNRIWLAPDVVRVLDEFAARAKRRR